MVSLCLRPWRFLFANFRVFYFFLLLLYFHCIELRLVGFVCEGGMKTKIMVTWVGFCECRRQTAKESLSAFPTRHIPSRLCVKSEVYPVQFCPTERTVNVERPYVGALMALWQRCMGNRQMDFSNHKLHCQPSILRWLSRINTISWIVIGYMEVYCQTYAVGTYSMRHTLILYWMCSYYTHKQIFYVKALPKCIYTIIGMKCGILGWP